MPLQHKARYRSRTGQAFDLLLDDGKEGLPPAARRASPSASALTGSGGKGRIPGFQLKCETSNNASTSQPEGYSQLLELFGDSIDRDLVRDVWQQTNQNLQAATEALLVIGLDDGCRPIQPRQQMPASIQGQKGFPLHRDGTMGVV